MDENKTKNSRGARRYTIFAGLVELEPGLSSLGNRVVTGNVQTYTSARWHKKNVSAFVFVYLSIFTLFMLLPLYITPGWIVYPIFLFLCISPLMIIGRFYRKGLPVFIPLIILFAIIVASHLKAIMYGFTTNWGDFSDYLKFTLPVVFFISIYSLLRRYGTEGFAVALKFIIVTYSTVFLFYLIAGPGFLYSIGLGRGVIDFYRFGGIDMNPNAYAGISVALIVLSLYCFDSKRLGNIFILILVLSLIASQSRTNIIAFFSLFLIFVFISRYNIYHKTIILLIVSTTVLVAFSLLDLYWLTHPGRFDFENDRSLNIRFERAFDQYYQFQSYVGLLGVGPGRGFLDRLDTSAYIMYLLRYGWLGLTLFILVHVIPSMYLFYYMLVSRIRNKIRYSKDFRFIVASALFPLYMIVSNISNEKWIDLKFILLFVLIMAINIYIITRLRNVRDE